MRKIISFFAGIKKGAHAYGNNISNLVNTILLFIVYLLGVGITSIIAKLSGKHFYRRSIDKGKKTYWGDMGLELEPIERYYRQF